MLALLAPTELNLCMAADSSGVRGSRLRRAWRVVRRQLKHRYLERELIYQTRYFCLNSGACGSTYLVNLLAANGYPRCFHEKKPDLNSIGVEHYERPLSRNRLTRILRYTRWDVGFEANNRLFSLAPEILHAFPSARFIHLVRDGRQAIRSAMSKPNVEAYLRENPRFQGSLAGGKHERPLKRLCRYWNNINWRIAMDLDSLEPATGTHLTLTFSDLIAGRLDGLEKFIEFPLPVRRCPIANQGQVRPEGAYPPFEEWPTGDRRMFWDLCGETMGKLGLL